MLEKIEELEEKNELLINSYQEAKSKIAELETQNEELEERLAEMEELQNKIEGFEESITYFDHIDNVERLFIIFLCKAETDKVKIEKDELIDYAWLPYEDALKKLTHDDSRELLKKAHKFLKTNG